MEKKVALRVSVVSLFTLFLFCCAASPAWAIRYNLVDSGGGDQQGHTLQGFIEFDFPCGTSCTTANVTDFTFSISGPSNFSYSYLIPDDVHLFQGTSGGYLNAGLGNLVVDYRRIGNFELRDSSQDSPYIQWVTARFPHYVSEGPVLTGGWVTVPFPPFVAVIGIAVPEPNAFTILLLAGSMLSALLRTRRTG